MNDQLRSGLEAEADVYEIPPGDLDRVKGRARRRTERRRRLTGSVAVLAVLAGTVTAVRRAGDEPGTGVATGVASGTLGDSGITWSLADDPDAALGGLWQWPAPVDAGDGVYALSTAPGQQSPDQPAQRVVWRSDDGVDWTPVDTPASFWMTDLSATDGRLYAIGTGPATKSSGGDTVHDVRVGWSEAGTEDWAQQSLPLDFAALAAQATWVRVDAMDVAAGPAGIVAVVSVRADLDVRALLDVDAPNGWVVTADGITVLGDGECPEGTPDSSSPGERDKTGAAQEPARVYGAYCENGRTASAEEVHGVASRHSWAELDLPDDLVDAVLGRPFAFHAAGGDAPFERVDVEASPQLLGGGAYVEPTADGFTLVTSRQADMTSPPQVEVVRSPDGRTWERQAGAIPGLQQVAAIGSVDGHLAVVGHGDPSSLYAELHPDGWRVTSLAEVLGVEVGADRGLFASSAAIGPLGVVVGVGVPAGDGTEYRVLASRDGRTWSSDSLRELTGRDDLRGVSQIVMRGDRVAVSVRTGAPEQEVTGRVAVVGTPR